MMVSAISYVGRADLTLLLCENLYAEPYIFHKMNSLNVFFFFFFFYILQGQESTINLKSKQQLIRVLLLSNKDGLQGLC